MSDTTGGIQFSRVPLSKVIHSERYLVYCGGDGDGYDWEIATALRRSDGVTFDNGLDYLQGVIAVYELPEISIDVLKNSLDTNNE